MEINIDDNIYSDDFYDVIFLEYFFHGFEVEWLRINFIHSCLETTHFIMVVNMSSDPDNFGLFVSTVAILM